LFISPGGEKVGGKKQRAFRYLSLWQVVISWPSGWDIALIWIMKSRVNTSCTIKSFVNVYHEWNYYNVLLSCWTGKNCV